MAFHTQILAELEDKEYVAAPLRSPTEDYHHPLFTEHPEFIEDVDEGLRFFPPDVKGRFRRKMLALAVDARGGLLPRYPEAVELKGTEPFRLALWFCPFGVSKSLTLRATHDFPPLDQQNQSAVLYEEKQMVIRSIEKTKARCRWSWLKRVTTGPHLTEKTMGADVKKQCIWVGVRRVELSCFLCFT